MTATIALGDFQQVPHIYADLLSKPHLLIVGATGSGKSVLLNGLIYTSLHILRGTEGKLILIDPKRVELGQYRHLKQCIRYANDRQSIIEALRFAVSLMESRFSYMEKHRLRMYDGEDVYIMIDEYADIMTTCRKEALPLLRSLLSLARAAKIHVIACTQQCYAKILDSSVICNFDWRIALRTANATQSRMILGCAGAESLQAGECLIQSPTGVRRLPVPYLTDDFLNAFLDYLQPKRRTIFQRLFKAL